MHAQFQTEVNVEKNLKDLWTEREDQIDQASGRRQNQKAKQILSRKLENGGDNRNRAIRNRENAH